MVKKVFMVLVCVSLCLTLFAGCGDAVKNQGDKSADSTSVVEEKTTEQSTGEPAKIELKDCKLLYYYWNEPQKAVVDKTIEEFNKIYPNIKIESTVIPWAQYWTKLQTSLPSGAGPDLYQLNAPHAVEYLPAGLALSLQDKIDRDKVDMTFYPDSIKQLYNYNGQQYAMPKDYDSIGLFYNKSMFDKAKVKYPDSSWTWDNLLEAAKKLTIEKNQYGFAIDTYMQTGIGNFIFQNGGSVYNENNTKSAINSPENVETFQFLQDMIYKYKVSPTAGELVETPSYMQFQAEKVAMITFGSWYVDPLYQALGDKLGVAPMPVKKTKACMLHGLGYAIDAKTKFAEEAWAFVKYCSEEEAMKMQADVVIPAYKGMDVKWTEKFPALDCKIFTEAAGYGVPLPVAAKNSTLVEQAMYNALDKIWNQKMGVAEALAQAETNMNAEFAK